MKNFNGLENIIDDYSENIGHVYMAVIDANVEIVQQVIQARLRDSVRFNLAQSEIRRSVPYRATAFINFQTRIKTTIHFVLLPVMHSRH